MGEVAKVADENAEAQINVVLAVVSFVYVPTMPIACILTITLSALSFVGNIVLTVIPSLKYIGKDWIGEREALFY